METDVRLIEIFSDVQKFGLAENETMLYVLIHVMTNEGFAAIPIKNNLFTFLLKITNDEVNSTIESLEKKGFISVLRTNEKNEIVNYFNTIPLEQKPLFCDNVKNFQC